MSTFPKVKILMKCSIMLHVFGKPQTSTFPKVKIQMKCSIMLHVFGKPLNKYFSKSEDPDEMQHNAACIP